jgi:2-methylisocitrate lyase-like PEP mutase family enzyme
MQEAMTTRPIWRDVLRDHAPLLRPAAHDALTAGLIERAGFPAYQIGGFALVGAMHAVPDIDLEHYGENSAAAREIIETSPLPVLIDGDNGYGDVKNVTRTVRGYEAMGAAAIFIEDQQSPKRCGHMANKKVVPAAEMERKIRAAVAARSSADFFILARTDALAPLGVDEAIERAKRYLAAGADGAYVEGPTNRDELERIGRALGHAPLAVSMLEDGGKTPWLPPAEFAEMGFSIILYPTTVLFRATRAIQRALDDLAAGRPTPSTWRPSSRSSSCPTGPRSSTASTRKNNESVRLSDRGGLSSNPEPIVILSLSKDLSFVGRVLVKNGDVSTPPAGSARHDRFPWAPLGMAVSWGQSGGSETR